MGSGVTPRKLPTLIPSKEEVEEDVPAVVTPPEAAGVWMDRASVHDQHLIHPETCKFGEAQAKIFDLSKSADLEEYGKLEALAVREGGPGVAMLDKERQFFEGVYHVFLTYRPMQYKKLIPSKDDLKDSNHDNTAST